MGWTPPPEAVLRCQSGNVAQSLKPKEASIMKMITVGIDLAKSVFQVKMDTCDALLDCGDK